MRVYVRLITTANILALLEADEIHIYVAVRSTVRIYSDENDFNTVYNIENKISTANTLSRVLSSDCAMWLSRLCKSIINKVSNL